MRHATPEPARSRSLDRAPRSRLVIAALLLGAVLGLAAVQDAQLPHVHTTQGAAIFDEQHVLDTLARLPGAATPPAAPATALAAVVVPAPTPSDVAPPAARSARPSDPRAPPPQG